MIVVDNDLEIRLARSEADLVGAQRLRYRVFVEELGGDGEFVDHARRLERDALDPYFEHLVLVDRRRDEAGLDHVVGAYRLLSGEAAARAGRFYSQAEFDLAPLRALNRQMLELGRSCIDAAYRGGLGLFLLWNGVAEYVQRHGIDLLFGVASFHGTDPAPLAPALSFLHHRHLAPPQMRPRALGAQFQTMNLIPAQELDRRAALAAIPPLIKAYLRIGGVVGEGAFVDRDFNTTDVCLVLDTGRMTPRQRALYARETPRG